MMTADDWLKNGQILKEIEGLRAEIAKMEKAIEEKQGQLTEEARAMLAGPVTSTPNPSKKKKGRSNQVRVSEEDKAKLQTLVITHLKKQPSQKFKSIVEALGKDNKVKFSPTHIRAILNNADLFEKAGKSKVDMVYSAK